MFTLDLLFLFIGVLAVLGELVFPSFFLYLYYDNRSRKTPVFNPEVCVIVPCRGFDKDLYENLLAICAQEYQNFRVIFVIDSKEDTAYQVIEKIVSDVKYASIEFSEIQEKCSGKISALLSGLKAAGDVEVYVFADSDIKPKSTWLGHLVSNLSDEKIGATTAFRWLFPHDLKSSFISTWNMTSMTSIFHPLSNYAWGGSTAIKKALFEKLGVAERWKVGFSDDLILTDSVKKAGLQIRFVPGCIVSSAFELNLKKFVNWSVQQVTWVRWYNPFIWYFSLFGLICLKVSTILGFILLYLGYTIPALLMISTILIEILYGLIASLIMRKFMPYSKKEFGSLLHYVFLMPAIFFLITYIMISSIFKKEIKWGGRAYSRADLIKNLKS